MDSIEHPRSIKSFAIRDRRLSPHQQEAYDQRWRQYGLAVDVPLNADSQFGRQAPLVMDIGFGAGESLLKMARAHPEVNWIGVEVYRPGIHAVMAVLQEESISNVRLYHADVCEVMQKACLDHSLHGVHIFFSDPWPKRRHHKRRLVNPEFIASLAPKLISGGYIHFATDCEDYAMGVAEHFAAQSAFAPAEDVSFYEKHSSAPHTRFGTRGVRLGHRITDLQVVKV